MIPGEPFIDDQPRQLRLPGYHKPRRDTWWLFERAMYVLLIVIIGGCGINISKWFITDPQPPSCIGFPEAEFPVYEWRAFDGAWIYNGHIIGYSLTESAPCMSINPIDN
jgi:hypothetical protein